MSATAASETNSSLHSAAKGDRWQRTAGVYSVASLGAGLFYGFNNATLPLILQQFTANPLLIGLLSSTRSIEGVVVQPLVGAWSDRLWTPLGRRRPFMLVGVPLSAVFLVLAARAPNLPTLVAAVFLFSLLFNIAVDPLNALLADLFPAERRSTVSGLANVVQFVGMVAILLGAAQLANRRLLPLTFYVVAAGMLASFAVTVAGVREPRFLGRDPADAAASPGLGGYVRELLRHGMAFRFLVCLFLYNFGGNAILPYLTLFSTKVIHTSAAVAEYLFLGLVLSTGLLLLPAGILAARVGRRPVLAGGIALMAVTAVGGLLIQTIPQTLVVIVLAGVANAAITATNWPLLTELVPADEVGVFAGIKTAFESVAIPASVLLSSALIDLWGYRAIFLVLTIGALGALLVLATVRMPGRGRG
jgi:maltose/moltooligosaccharide transporter